MKKLFLSFIAILMLAFIANAQLRAYTFTYNDEFGGRAVMSAGRGIANVRITMTDAAGNIRTAVTSSFGYYRFTDVAAGETYIFSAVAKRYSFTQPLQILNVNEDTEEINFTGDYLCTV